MNEQKYINAAYNRRYVEQSSLYYSGTTHTLWMYNVYYR